MRSMILHGMKVRDDSAVCYEGGRVFARFRNRDDYGGQPVGGQLGSEVDSVDEI